MVAVGGVYGRDMPMGTLETSKEYRGWQTFLVPKGAEQTFLYHNWWLASPIRFMLTPTPVLPLRPPRNTQLRNYLSNMHLSLEESPKMAKVNFEN